MSAIHIQSLLLPGERAENGVITGEKRTCFSTFYPFKIFPQKQLREVNFEPITILYGGNGSGKSTLINVIASLLNAVRYSDFNHSPFFERYVSLCQIRRSGAPKKAYVLTSDDVFDYVLSARSVNGKLDERRETLFKQYVETYRAAFDDPAIMNLRGLDDYERWKDVRDILSKKRSQSQFIRDRVEGDIDLYSNGESAMRYFVDRIEEEDAVYLLDEPENSLSAERQLQLADYIAASSRASSSQFIIATHSPLILSLPRAKIYDLDRCPVSVAEWTELPNVRVWFDFFMKHKDKFEN